MLSELQQNGYPRMNMIVVHHLNKQVHNPEVFHRPVNISELNKESE
jgi:hypothetical protein